MEYLFPMIYFLSIHIFTDDLSFLQTAYPWAMFFIYIASVYLVSEKFNTLIFNVIINIWELILVILWIDFWLFCEISFLSLIFFIIVVSWLSVVVTFYLFFICMFALQVDFIPSCNLMMINIALLLPVIGFKSF